MEEARPTCRSACSGKAFQLFYGVRENAEIFFKLIRAAAGAY